MKILIFRMYFFNMDISLIMAFICLKILDVYSLDVASEISMLKNIIRHRDIG